MTRARFAAGDQRIGDELLTLLDHHVYEVPLTDEDVRELRRVKARVERERIGPGEDPAFHLKLGRGSLSDVDFTVELLQLRHDVRRRGTLAAIDELETAGHLDVADAEALRASHVFCTRTRSRLYLVTSTPSDSLPSTPETLTWLARSLDTTAAQLREDYRRVTRRARRVTERLFYGLD
jgi:glutamate-ammonia-ligase adenylyltransferase